MRSYIDFNDGWIFHEGFSGELTTNAAPGKSVRLPHTAVELPFSYFDERSYQRPFTYQKTFNAEPSWAGRGDLAGNFLCERCVKKAEALMAEERRGSNGMYWVRSSH